ncbi:MAG: hypothetical protein AAFZ07_00250 [Actinomycetota bacterium]
MRRVGSILTVLVGWWAMSAGAVSGSAEADREEVAPVDGYLLLDATGVVHEVGGATSFAPDQPVRGAGDVAVSLSARPDGEGYTAAFADGSMGAGGAAYVPDLLSRLLPGERVAATRLTPDLVGSWTATVGGRVIVEGTASHHGDLDGVPLQGGVIDLVPTSSGNGYWLVAADGGVFAFGDATFHGSMGGRPLNAPVVDLVADPDGVGYWLVAADGGVFAFEAPFVGSLPGVLAGRPLNAPVVAGVEAPGGYVLVGADGGVFVFADDAPFLGSLADQRLAGPIVDLVATSAVDRWVVSGTVLDDGDGPELCLFVLASLPPQCGGPQAVDLDWDDVEGVEDLGGVRWGSGRFVVSAVDPTTQLIDAVRILGPAPDDARFVPRDAPIIEPGCETPPGGWTHPDPSRVTFEAFHSAVEVVRGVPGHGNTGVGRIVDPGPFPDDPDDQLEWERAASDPFNQILVLRHVGDTTSVVAAVREVWGGPLCLLPARSTFDELLAAQDEVRLGPGRPNVFSTGIGWFDGLRIEVLVADGAEVEAIRREVAPVQVRASAWFEPVVSGEAQALG